MLYIGLHYSPASAAKLLQYCHDHNLDLSVNYDGTILQGIPDFHTTLLYGQYSGIGDPHELEYPISPIKLRPSHLEVFGRCLCLRFHSSSELEELREYFSKRYMVVESHDYKPHVTLTYNFGREATLPKKKLRSKLVVERLKIKLTSGN